MINKESRNELRRNRHKRIRKTVSGTRERPRLVVYKSHNHIYAQVVNDEEGNTLCAANSIQKDVAEKIDDEMSKVDVAGLVGRVVAEKALKSGLEQVVFDRAGYKYHGRLAALAEGARKAGLKF